MRVLRRNFHLHPNLNAQNCRLSSAQMSIWNKSLAVTLLVCLQAIFSYEASAQSVFWQGEKSCEDLLDEPISSIPGGFPLKTVMANGQAHYRLPKGGTLKLRMSESDSVSIPGENFVQAHRNLVTQKPLQKDFSGRSNEVVFALVQSSYQLDLDFTHDDDLSLFQLRPGGYNVVMNSKISVIDWAGYDAADDASRRQWDKMTCESYHHELGHILIGAQLFAEAESLWVDLRGEDQPRIQSLTDELFDMTMQQVRQRQRRYHEQITTMGEELSYSKPYLELPFTWLD